MSNPIKQKTLLVAICLFAALVVATVLSSCVESNTKSAESRYKSPYDFSLFKRENGRLGYGIESQSRCGIDVSDHQGYINWSLVANDDIEFAIIRLGYRGYTDGEVYVDEQFESNISGAQAVGIPVGVYFFSQAINEEEAREEARFVLGHLQGRTLEYPIAYDFEPVSDPEGRANTLKTEQLSKNARTFCKIIENAGYDNLVYGNSSDIEHYDRSIREDYNIWFAEYNAPTPTAAFDFIIWQYSNAGEVEGIDAAVDMNVHILTP